MNILNEKKEVTPIITPSLGYKLRSINWNEDFYFDNPIDKEKINSIPKAIEISEKQISGRTITLRIDYADILHADAFTE